MKDGLLHPPSPALPEQTASGNTPPTAGGDSGSPQPPPAGFTLAPGTVLLIEAETQLGAQALFDALAAGQPGARKTLTQLSSDLFVARAQPSGRYFRFANFAKG